MIRTGYDVVVVGAGAAGLNAALLLGRARRRVAVIDGGPPRNAPAAHMHGFLSRDGLPPATLLELGRAEIARYGVGELPDIPGVRERWGKDVLHCPYCHGYEVRDRPLAVLGTHPNAVHQALLLRDWSENVLFFPHTLEVTNENQERLDARGVDTVEGHIERLVIDNDRLRGVQLDGDRIVPREAAFLFPNPIPQDTLLTGLGCEKNGWVTTDRTGRTSAPGVWAAGNVVDPRAQVITAAGMGSSAAFAINTGLLEEDVAEAVERSRPAGVR